MDAALGLAKARPAAGALIGVGGHGLGARPASDALVAVVVELVVGQLVDVQIGPHVRLGPGGQRVDLDQAVGVVPFHDAGVGAVGGLVAADGGDPGVFEGQVFAQRL